MPLRFVSLNLKSLFTFFLSKSQKDTILCYLYSHKEQYYLELVKNYKNTAVVHHGDSLSLRVISTANTVTEMLSLLDLMSFRTAEFNSFWNSTRWADVKPVKTGKKKLKINRKCIHHLKNRIQGPQCKSMSVHWVTKYMVKNW